MIPTPPEADDLLATLETARDQMDGCLCNEL